MSTENKIIAGIVVITIFLLLVVFFIIVLVAYINKRKKSFLAEKKNLQSLYENELLKTKLEIQEQTFQDISQEIHDNIGQSLSFIKLTINTINIDDRDNAKDKLSESKHLLTQAIQDLRDLSKTLSSDLITHIRLPKAVEQQLNLLQKSNLYQTHFVVNGEPIQYEQKQEIVLFRIVQELLNNAVKHSDAKEIAVEINYSDNELIIIVSDNGKGFDISKLSHGKGLGLDNMKKRMNLLNGHFEILSNENAGTKAVIRLRNEHKEGHVRS